MQQRLTLRDEQLTGIDSFDDQHRQILALADRAAGLDHVQLGNAWLLEALSTFVEYVQYHFAAEEHLMQRTEYADWAKHRREHDDFRLEVSELVDCARRDDSRDVRERLIVLTSNWLTLHVAHADRTLADFVLDRRPPETIQLADSGTLRRAGALVADVESNGTLSDAEQYVHPAHIVSVG